MFAWIDCDCTPIRLFRRSMAVPSESVTGKPEHQFEVVRGTPDSLFDHLVSVFVPVLPLEQGE